MPKGIPKEKEGVEVEVKTPKKSKPTEMTEYEKVTEEGNRTN